MPEHDLSAPMSRPDVGQPTAAARSALVLDLLRNHNRALVRFLLTHLSNEQEAREVAQEAYVRLLQLDQPEAISFLRTYLFRTALNLAIDRVRRRRRTERVERIDLFDECSQAASVEQVVLAEQEVALLKQAIEELKPKCRRAFVLHKFCERSVADVATEMHLTPRMVRAYIARAIFYCRLRLDGCGRGDATRAMMEWLG